MIGKDMRAKDVQKFFERVATDWDTMRLAYYDERVIERMAAVSGVDEGMTVAEVGTGTGEETAVDLCCGDGYFTAPCPGWRPRAESSGGSRGRA